MQRSNTEACIHETCNVRTQMHAYRKSARCEHRDAMSVSESIDSSRLLMSASELRAKAHRRRLLQTKPTSTVISVKSLRTELVVVVEVVVVDVLVVVVVVHIGDVVLVVVHVVVVVAQNFISHRHLLLLACLAHFCSASAAGFRS